MNSISLTRRLKVVNRLGLHARAATRLAQVANSFDAEIEVSHGDQQASANSVLALLMLQTCQGEEVEVHCSGEQAQQAMDAITTLFSSRFDEED